MCNKARIHLLDIQQMDAVFLMNSNYKRINVQVLYRDRVQVQGPVLDHARDRDRDRVRGQGHDQGLVRDQDRDRDRDQDQALVLAHSWMPVVEMSAPGLSSWPVPLSRAWR